MLTFSRLKSGRIAFLFALIAMPAVLQAQALAQQSTAQPPPVAVDTSVPAAIDAAVPSAAAPEPKAGATAPVAAEPPADQNAQGSAAAAAAPATTDEATEASDRAIERMKARIQELEARSDVAPDIRDQAIAQLRNALGQLEAASASAAASKRFQDSVQRSAERIAEAKQQLEAAQKDAADADFENRITKLPLAEAQQALDASNASAATIKADLDQLEGRLREMSTRATAAREEQTAERQALDALEGGDETTSSDAHPILADARRAAIAAERRARAAKLNTFEQELISLPARQASATARRDLAALKLDRLTKRIPIIEARVNALQAADTALRQAEADRDARKLAAKHPVLEAYVKDTEIIRQREAEAVRLLDQSKSRFNDIQAELARVRDSKVAAQQVLEIGSIGGEFSELLRTMRNQLPETSRLQRRIADRNQAIVDGRLKRLQAEEARRALTDTGNMAERILGLYAQRHGETPPAEVRESLEKLVGARRDLYVQLHDTLVTRISQLAESNAAERDLLNQTTQLRALLNSRLLWLPTSGTIGIGWLDQVRTSFGWILNVEAWQETASTLLSRAAQLPLPTALVLLVFSALVLFTRKMTRRLATIADAVRRYSSDNYMRTPEAMAITALLSVKTPLLIGYAGWLLTLPPPPPASEFSAAVGAGLLAVAYLLLFLRLIQFISAENGLFSAHFGWSERARAVLRRNVIWLKYTITPIALILGMINVSSAQSVRDGLGRFAFLAGAFAVAIFIARVIDPRRGVVADRISTGHPLWAMRMIWHPFISLVPLAVAGIALWGYYDGASQIRDGLLLSVTLIAGAYLIYCVIMRQVLVARRQLEIARALERREQARAKAAALQETEATGEQQPAPVVTEPEVDIASISDQTRQLVRLTVFLLLGTTLYFFWREALPSLALLDVPLWQQVITVDGAPRSMPVTVSNVFVALAIGIITLIAARNLPGLLEITALHRLRIEAGTRYAISAVSRYLIAIVGLIFAFRSIGFDWSQVQWIVAALGVGVGFGLQEIVANFISGLIILFERPVRVGDTVTIGNLTGTVSRIHIRATSMTDGENREIIIPNKSLITEKVINWTLTDSITRVTLKIGIAYGTDTLRAQLLILDAVKATPQVLDSPAPSVFFIGFGSKGLEFEVRAFVLQLAHRSAVINDLHVSIERALREKEIAMS
ncbi:mechanosensitive ion channel domain-containing protein [Hyphomicrobium sp. D-2]|uniref:mechanosensitive ion channel domain-containing protein n=1 Tax=Hyphomicrobium sp. D-2 TaxID=3041621 RepID=UPI002454D367|nr:mechanosensitive ion channel domain-containing protein [Hyphomicrobium sp. D-2]MDH4982560.1 mechanosensitive ion channel [Hyphomicrobium sp. D-2]